MRNAFAIYHTWPDLRNAEFEVLQRILGAARNVGCDVAVIDNAGRVIWSSPAMNLREGSELSPDLVDFAISLHFESPRICDIYTYYALWQPIIFYEDFGYEKSLDKFTTHNDLLSCHSDIAENHALNIFNGINHGPIEPLETLFHTLPEPFLEPNVTSNSKLFYIGINWERIGRPKGRYHDLLVMLDKKNLIRIYGPEEIHGVAPWGGFQTYQGELPFDGYSIRDAINESGICLALSSAAHRDTGIMSNRLFEGLAGGAAVIATPNPLIDKYFKDVVYEVDDSRGEAVLGQEIQSALREIRLNPAFAMDRVRTGQRILRDRCALEKSIKSIFTNNDMRVRNFQSKTLSEGQITVILIFTAGAVPDLENCISYYERQISCEIHLHVILNPDIAADVDVKPTDSVVSLTLHPLILDGQPARFDGRRPKPDRTGPTVAKILTAAKTPYVAFMNQADRVFSDHFASLARAIEDCAGAAIAASGTIFETQDATGKAMRSLHSVRFEDLDSLILVTGPDQRGRFLFATHLFKAGHHHLLQLLDGEEFRLLALAGGLFGPVAQSNYATHINDHTAPISIRQPVESIELQHQYVRDYYRCDSKWLERVSRAGKIPEIVHAYAPGAPIRWSNTLRTGEQTTMLATDRVYLTRFGEPVTKHLISGFSSPEAEAVWLASDRGVIEFSLPRGAASDAQDYDIVLSIMGRRSIITGRLQHCTFNINNISVAYNVLSENFEDVRIRIPFNALHNTNMFRLELVPDHSEQVVDENGRVTDARHLSILLRSITIAKNHAGRVPSLLPNEMRACIDGDMIVRAMTRGFYSPELDQTWMGKQAIMQFRTNAIVTNPVIRFQVSPGPARNGEAQRLAVKVGEREAGDFLLSNSSQIIEIPCGAEEINDQVVVLSLAAMHAESVVDEHGNLLDNRLLGVSFSQFGIFDTETGALRTASKGLGRTSRKFANVVKSVFNGENR